MKIGDDTIGVSNGDKVKIFSSILVLYVLIMIVFDWGFDQQLKEWDNYLVKGLLYSFFLSGLIYYSVKKFTKKVEVKIQIPLAEGEELEAYGMANLFISKETIGGKLGVTENTLLFHSHKFQIQRETVRIPFENIKSVKPCKVMWLLNNGIEVKTDLQRCVFVVNDRNTWLGILQSKMK